MKTETVAPALFESCIVAILRATEASRLVQAAHAVWEGGVRAIEVTMTTPGALGVLQQAREMLDEDVILGVGSVLDAETARAAILAGARFVVCPTLNLETIALCNRYGIPVFPGAYTPTELLAAWEAGATAVKLFPASVGGPAYVKAVKAPLPQIRLMPTGGVDLETAAAFLTAGADLLGVGSALVSQSLLEKGDFKTITQRARRFREIAAA